MSAYKITAIHSYAGSSDKPVTFRGDSLEAMKELFRVMDGSMTFHDMELVAKNGVVMEKKENWRVV